MQIALLSKLNTIFPFSAEIEKYNLNRIKPTIVYAEALSLFTLNEMEKSVCVFENWEYIIYYHDKKRGNLIQHLKCGIWYVQIFNKKIDNLSQKEF